MGRAKTVTESPIEFSLLGLLYRKPRYGYKLYQSLCAKTGLGLIWTVKQAQLYSILSKFQAHGLLSCEIEGSSGRPARKVFSLTSEGKSVFMRWVKAPSPRRDFRLEFLAKLYFVRLYYPASARSLIEAQKELCLEWLSAMEAAAVAAQDGSSDDFVFRYRVNQLRSMSAWIDECLEVVEANPPTRVRSP